MARALLLAPLLLSLTVSVHALATCYYPDGVTTEPSHVPCNQTTSSPSACCDPEDACSTSGICLGRSGWTYRGSCTDQSWESENCAATAWPQCLTDPSTKKKYDGWTAIWSCASPGTGENSFCCAQGDSSSSCCADDFDLGVTGPAFKPGFDQFVINITQAAVAAAAANTSHTSSLSSPSSTTGASTASATSPSTPAQTTTASSGNSELGTKIGLGVGIPLGVLVAGILSLLFYREYSKRKGYGAAGSYNGGDSKSGVPSPMVSHAPMDHSGGYGGGYAPSNQTTTPQPAYSPNPPKANLYSPAPVYEAPQNNVHEMRA